MVIWRSSITFPFYYDPRKKVLGYRRVKMYFRLQYSGSIRLGALGLACEVTLDISLSLPDLNLIFEYGRRDPR